MMKTTFLAFIALLLLTVAGCSKDDTADNSNVTPAAVKSTLVAGSSWRVTYYFHNNADATNDFTGFNFVFASDGTVKAINDLFNVSGTWNTLTDDSVTKLVLTFASPEQFQEISEDWKVTGRTDTKVTLENVSGGSGGTDKLTFERN